ncbi:uncharacterized protein LOC111382270 [Olea europaea var. sylvestris]|uniref:SHSP domain-containing protein n=1 Tax=Olea europaea subsp. europaea TaxID=158383 RepID=A0A8S0QDE7_OLEEU|nr:uncharacterized protein LOC111382270 [Olea europaea var. sylvestris]CAA2963180.1 Hypothetical predicted protein [Olea europaea subsp. europaea]
MKVHPVPVTLQYDIASALSQANVCGQRKLRRLPHIFAKVLELPFRSDADVLIDETPDSLRFVVATGVITGEVGAHAIEIYPGVTKIVIRVNDVVDLSGNELEMDKWRFRLPDSTWPGLATAVYHQGELVVTVPKGGAEEDGGAEGGDGGDLGGGRFVLVQ